MTRVDQKETKNLMQFLENSDLKISKFPEFNLLMRLILFFRKSVNFIWVKKFAFHEGMMGRIRMCTNCI